MIVIYIGRFFHMIFIFIVIIVLILSFELLPSSD